MPRVKRSLCWPSLPMPMSPVAMPVTASFVEQDFGGGKARIDFDAERFRLARQPAADIAERDDEIAVIVHQRRHAKFGSRSAPDGRAAIEAVVADRGLDRRVLAAPFRDQAVEPDRIDHRAGQDMGADLGALLHDDDRMSGLICLSRMAAARPAGPAPTITTSNSIASRAGSSGVSWPARSRTGISVPRFAQPGRNTHAVLP